MAIKCVMFDFGNVVGIFKTEDWFSFLLDHRGNCLEPHETFGSLVGILKKFDLGQLSASDFYQAFKDAYQLQGVTRDEFFNKLCSVLWIDWDMVEIRDQLKQKGIVTVLVTNMNPYHAWYIRHNYPSLMAKFDHALVSCEEGVAKPDPEAFIRPLDSLGFKAEEACLFDDSFSNVEAFCKLGGKGWHYNVTDQYYCQNGKLEEERKKLKNFLDLLWNRGIMAPKLP